MRAKTNKAIIIGAGPSGLVTANELLKQGWHVEIYEALDTVGGMCRSFNWNQYNLDIGPHVFHTPNKDLAKYWKEQFGDLLAEGEYWAKNVQGDNFDEFYDYPLSWESISKYPKEIKRKIIDETSLLTSESKAKASNYAEYIEALTGKTLRKMFFERYPEKIWGISVKDMTADWAPKRVNIFDKKALFFEGQWTAVGRNGAGRVYERIADQIRTSGGSIYLNSPITNIEISEASIKSISTESKQINIESDDIVISSLPIVNLIRMLGHSTELKYRGVMIFYLECSKKRILPKDTHWLYYDSKEVYFSRITEPKQMNVDVPSDENSLLTVEVPYSVGDSLDVKDIDEITKEIIEQVEKVGLITKNDVIDATMVKEKYVYPIQFQGYSKELVRVKSIVGEIKQLYSLGAGGEFNYADTQIIFEKAFDFAKSISNDSLTSFREIKELSVSKFNKVLDINGSLIGDDYSPYIIAEAGMNHNGSLALGKKMIDEAVKTGCNAIKFQTFLPESRVSSKIKSVHFAEKADGIEETLFDMFAKLAMPFPEQKKLFEYAKKESVEIFSTPFDFESVDFLEEMGVKVYKIASMDLVNLPLIEYVARTKKPLILSTGMSNLGEIEEALNVIAKTGNPNVALLHCNSTYPASEEDMNLRAINTLKKCFNIPVGLSDHTFGLTVSKIALSIGANIIERHFTLDRTSEGPDHILSSEPEEISKLVDFSNRLNVILGDGVKKVQATEYETYNLQRKSLYASVDIKKGQIIEKNLIQVKGPSGGIMPKFLNIVEGRVAQRDIHADYPITWNDI
jgi:sialic acid synthase SpsE/protoporphyrinogen oxidase